MKKFALFTLGILITISCSFLIACEIKQEDNGEKINATVETQKDSVIDSKEEYKEKTEAELNKFDVRIDQLKAKAKDIKEETEAEFDRTIDELKKKKEAADYKLDQLKTASEESWERVKSQLESTMNDLENFYNKTRSCFG